MYQIAEKAFRFSQVRQVFARCSTWPHCCRITVTREDLHLMANWSMKTQILPHPPCKYLHQKTNTVCIFMIWMMWFLWHLHDWTVSREYGNDKYLRAFQGQSEVWFQDNITRIVLWDTSIKRHGLWGNTVFHGAEVCSVGWIWNTCSVQEAMVQILDLHDFTGYTAYSLILFCVKMIWSFGWAWINLHQSYS